MTDPKTGEPTGLLRSAYGVLRGVPRADERVQPQALEAGLKSV